MTPSILGRRGNRPVIVVRWRGSSIVRRANEWVVVEPWAEAQGDPEGIWGKKIYLRLYMVVYTKINHSKYPNDMSIDRQMALM